MDDDPIERALRSSLQRAMAGKIRLKRRSGRSGSPFGGFGHAACAGLDLKRAPKAVAKSRHSIELVPTRREVRVALPESDRRRVLSPEEKRDRRKKRLVKRKTQRRNKK